MKRILTVIIIVLGLSAAKSDAGIIDFGFFTGLSTPNERINDIYNADKIINKLKTDTLAGNILRDAAGLGWHFGAIIKIPIGEVADFHISAAFHYFPEETLRIQQAGTEEFAKYKVSAAVIPLSVGISYTFLNTELIDLYAVGDLSWNYFINSNTLVNQTTNFGISTPSDLNDARVGCGFGAGMKFELVLFDVYLEGKYNFSNIIGKVSDEKNKAYFALSVGILF